MREWFVAGLLLFGMMGDIASRYYGAASESHVTAGQVATLTDQVRTLSTALKDLSEKIGTMPRSAEVGALAARMDRAEASVGDVKQTAAVLRADVDNLMHPLTFRNPR